MGCRIILLASVPAGDDGSGIRNVSMDVAELPDAVRPADVSYDYIAEVVAGLDEGARSQLVEFLSSEVKRTMTATDIRNFKVVSNVTVDDLYNIHKISREFYPLPEMSDDGEYVIMDCSDVSANGDEYSGMLMDGDGRRIVLIKNRQDALRFFRYLNAKASVRGMIANEYTSKGVLKRGSGFEARLREFEPDLPERLDATYGRWKSDWRGMSGGSAVPDMLLDFLDNAGKFGTVEVGGKITSAQRTLNNVMRVIADEYWIRHRAGMSDIEFEVRRHSTGRGGRSGLTIEKGKLYDIIREFVPDFGVDKADFVRMKKDELEELLYDNENGVFGRYERTPLYGRSNVRETSTPFEVKEGGEEYVAGVRKASVTEWLGENWDELTKRPPKSMSAEYRNMLKGKDGERMTYSAFMKLDAGTRKGIIDGLKLRWFDEGGVGEDGSRGVWRDVKAETYTAKTKDGTKREQLRVYCESDRVRTTKPDYGESYVTFVMRDLTLGEGPGWSYSTTSVLSPVDGEESDGRVVSDGMYNGRFVYSRFENGRKAYYITDHVANGDVPGSRYERLGDALDGIDYLNGAETLIEHAKMTPKKMADGMFFKTVVEMSGIQKGKRQNVTVLDYAVHGDVPALGKFFPAFRQLVGYRGSEFHELFDAECGTAALVTPEMCFTYLTEHYHDLFVPNKANGYRPKLPQYVGDLVGMIKENHAANRERYDAIVKDIAGAGHRSFRIEDVEFYSDKTYENRVVLRPLSRQGFQIRSAGDMVGDMPSGEFVTQEFKDMADYISEKYGATVRTVTTDFLEKDEGAAALGLNEVADSTKGYVHDGVITVNTSIGTTEDLSQEFGHLLMGVVKANDPGAYDSLIASMRFSDNFKQEVARLRNRGPYRGMAYEDAEEEVFLRRVSRALYGNINSHFLYETDPEAAGEAVGRALAEAGAVEVPEVEQEVDRVLREAAGYNDKVPDGAVLADGSYFNPMSFNKAFAEILRVLRGMQRESGDNGLFPDWLRSQFASEKFRSNRVKTNLIRDLFRRGDDYIQERGC